MGEKYEKAFTIFILILLSALLVFTSCSLFENSSEGLEYTLSGDGTYYIVSGIGTCDDTDVVIPSKYKGLPVRKIGEGAFSRGNSLTSINIPNSVTSIRDRAFEHCTSLTIYCEAESEPSDWDPKWNSSYRPVVWGHTHAYENGICVCGKAE